MLTQDDTVMTSQHIAVREIDGETMILTLKDTHLHTMNHVGECIYGCIRSGITSVAAIVTAVAAEYSVEPDQVATDVTQFLDELLARGIVVRANGENVYA